MRSGHCSQCKELWRLYGQAMTARVWLLGQEELALGGPEWTTVADALTAAASEQDRVRREIVRHEAEVHHRASPLATEARTVKEGPKQEAPPAIRNLLVEM